MALHDGQPVLQEGAPLGTSPVAVIMVHGRNAGPGNILDLVPALGRPEITYLAPAAADRTWYPHSFMADIATNEPWLSSALGVLRDGTTLSITVVPLADPNGIGHLGVAQRYSFQKHGPIEASWRAVSHLGRLAVEEVHLFSRLLLGKPGAALVERATFVRETSAQASTVPLRVS